MRESDIRSLRILVDLQGCQTPGSASRGVGRYSKSLFMELARTAAPRDIFGLASDDLPHPVRWENVPEERMLRPPRLPEWGVPRDFEGGQQDSLDAALYASAAAAVRPDLIHVSHIFEGYSDRVAIPNAKTRPAGQVFSATLYDLIPIRFKEHYFRDRRFQAWYYHRVQLLRQADLLLSISEASRQDAINLLGLDPARIVTIHGGIGEHFMPPTDREAARAQVKARYQINRQQFVLYTGGDDYRKNLQGAIEGYASLPPGSDHEHNSSWCALSSRIVGPFSRLRQERSACLRTTSFSLGTCRRTIWSRSMGVATLSSFPRSTKGWDCPSSRRWLAAHR